MERATEGRLGAQVERLSAPVKLWAVIGGVGLFMFVGSFGRWLVGGDMHAVPAGPDPFSGWHLAGLRVAECLSAAGGLYLIARFVIRPLVRERTLHFDGMLIIGFLTTYWQDPLANYYAYTFSYNTHFVNMGSWYRHIPGLSVPNISEPLFFIIGIYVWWFLGCAMFGCWVLRRLRLRWPGLSILGLFAILFAVFAMIDLIGEVVLIRWLHLVAYSGTIDSLSLWAGHWYQFPLYEPIAMASFMTGCTMLRYFRDDRGLSWAERGVDSLKIGSRAKLVVRVMAVTGTAHAVIFLGYYGPYMIFTPKADSFPTMPSYLPRLEGTTGLPSAPERR